ncbi:hypothetical protein NDU88_005129 [Pleurodeles waltl]|uniref:Uncharacterized protein n=1 Tax=Pleurodeles waltl TaxID=8319 RepID=A0AAV7MYC5_PLEWA|nr:hypothetical protein NDU88_005129 [Pleurodeles waltl]
MQTCSGLPKASSSATVCGQIFSREKLLQISMETHNPYIAFLMETWADEVSNADIVDALPDWLVIIGLDPIGKRDSGLVVVFHDHLEVTCEPVTVAASKALL